MNETIIAFQGNYRFLSNFYMAPIVFEGLTYPSAEHAYQAAKTDDPDIKERFTVLRNPGTAKQIGKTLPLKEGWDRVATMRKVVDVKFEPQGYLLLDVALLNLSDVTLYHGNDHHDNFWGGCNCEDCADRPHRNMLGLLLMQRRLELQRLWDAAQEGRLKNTK